MNDTRATSKEIGLQQVILVQDNDSHNYVIPAEMEEQFDDLLQSGEKGEEEFENFGSKNSQKNGKIKEKEKFSRKLKRTTTHRVHSKK